MPPGVRVEPVVKADAYGHGLVPVALTLETAGADALCLATLDEALALRDAGLALRLLVLYPIPPARVAEAARRGIELAAGDPVLLDRTLVAWASGRDSGDELRIQLELETGLGRGGVLPDAAAAAAERIRSTPGVTLAGLWSHLQAAEDAALSAGQVAAFTRVAGLVTGTDDGSAVGRHLAASGGLLGRVAPALDAVRIGLATYGIVPEELGAAARDGGPGRALEPVLALHARPVRVVDLPADHGISYGPTFRTTRRSRIATLPLGYGDGWSRQLSNRATAIVRGVRVPLVGNVAMDAIMADATDVPGDPVSVDDEFVLIGTQGPERITALDVAQARTTNSWEVVTTLSGRVTRVYTAGRNPVAVRSLADWRGVWRASSSGTATSSTSRSTRS